MGFFRVQGSIEIFEQEEAPIRIRPFPVHIIPPTLGHSALLQLYLKGLYMIYRDYSSHIAFLAVAVIL